MLAEIVRRLHINIQLVYTEAPTREAALMSGKADVVFWFEIYAGVNNLWNKMMWLGLEK